MRYRILIFLSLLLAALCATARTYSVDELPNVQLQDHTKHLVNPDGIVPDWMGARIDSLLLDARRQSSAEVVAVIVDDIDTQDIDSYATKLFNLWGIGKKDKNNGILIIVAKDGRAATIRTGYGAEGVLPDIITGRIVRNVMIPRFKEGDFSGGLYDGVKAVHEVVTDPEAREELMSEQTDNYQGAHDGDAMLSAYLTVAAVAAVALAIWLIAMVVNANRRKMTDYERYNYLHRWQLVFWVVSLVFVGIPILAAVALWLLTRYYRNRPRQCPRCHASMRKLDEAADNAYLSYAQDLEERIKSVDYDVWLCPECGEKDIYSFINPSSSFTQCPQCNARTYRLTGTRIIQEPTYSRGGQGEKQYDCLHCHHHGTKLYSIPKKERPVVVAGVGGGGRGGGFGGGGFGGGFGGGLTGGGGATGRW